MSRTIRNFLSGPLGLGLGLALGLSALTPAPADAQSTRVGQREFLQRCATCHGRNARGDGPMADVLKTKPADLATLTRRNGGKFPFLKVYRTVDGRATVRAHGPAEMPVWGNYFTAEALSFKLPPDMSTDEIVMARILAVVYYLQTIQLE